MSTPTRRPRRTCRLQRVLAAVCLTCLFGAASPALAEPPTYWILRPPAQTRKLGHSRGVYPAQASYLSRHAYAYGWFGVPARQHWTRHEGYLQRYVQFRKH